MLKQICWKNHLNCHQTHCPTKSLAKEFKFVQNGPEHMKVALFDLFFCTDSEKQNPFTRDRVSELVKASDKI